MFPSAPSKAGCDLPSRSWVRIYWVEDLSMSDHEELESSVAAWVLGALEADEAASIRVHVDGCATCQQTVARLRRAAAALPLEVEEISPPARLRERVYVAAAAARASTIPSAPARKRVVPPRA